MNILIIFVEKTEYNIARIQQVYEKSNTIECDYVYCNESLSGHQARESLPSSCIVLDNNKILKLFRIMKSKKYDFFQINGYSDLIRLTAIVYAKMCKIPYAIETDTQLKVPQNYIKRIAKNFLLKFIFGKNAYGFAGGSRQTELFRYYGMKEEHITIMPMTVNTEEFRKIAHMHSKEFYKEKYGFVEKKVVLYIGRFEKVKNLYMLIDAFTRVKKNKEDCELCLVGKGSLQKDLEKYCRDLNIEDHVYFYTYKLMPELAEIYSMADVFVLPSFFEPWGLVVNEACACGVPVIASDKVGSGDDLIIPGINGDIFECDDLEKLSMLINNWIYEKKGKVGIDISEKWNFKTYYDIWSKKMKELCDE